MSNTDKLIEGILTSIDRESTLSNLLETKADQPFIDSQVELFIATLKKDLKKYE